MKSASSSSPHPLHLFRAILREAGYHPDPAARSYLSQYASNSFRDAKIKLATRRKWTHEARLEREAVLLRNARQFLSILKRSNEGYLGPFRKTLSLTYGRTGQRRRPLMRQIMRIRSEPKSQALEGLPSYHPEVDFSTNGESKTETLDPVAITSANPHANPKKSEIYMYGPGIVAWPPRRHRPYTTDEIPPMFQALSISQKSAASNIPSQGRANKSKGDKLPETTIWGTPMPESRTRNAMLKWFASEAALLLPYLPPKEWVYIRDIALGTTRLTVPPRRPTSTTHIFTTPDAERAPSLLAAPKGEPKYNGRKQGNPHKFTQRFLANQYEWLLRHVPLLIGGEGEAAYGSSPVIPALAKRAQVPEEPVHASELQAVGRTGEQENAASRQHRPRPTGVFLWHSTVLDKGKPIQSIPQTLGDQANKALFG